MNALLLALLLTQPVPGPVRGPNGPINLINGSVSQSGMTLTVTGGGGGGSPGGLSGNLQINNGAGGFGPYVATTCGASNYVTGISASGALTCSVPTFTLTPPVTLTGVTDTVPLTINAVAGQTAKLQSWQVNGVEKAFVNKDGGLNLLGPAGTGSAGILTVIGYDQYGQSISMQLPATGYTGWLGMTAKAFGGGGGAMGFMTHFTSDVPDRFSITDHLGGERLTVLDSGNVGVANNNPSYRLDVTGTFRVSGAATVGSITGSPVTISNISAGGTPSATTYLRGDGSWQTPPGGGGGSPGGVSGNLQINSTGTFGAYGGTAAAPANQWLRSLDANGAGTWTQPLLTNIGNPTGDTTFTFPSASKMLWTFTGSTDNAFSIHGDGAFTGVGDLVHFHKTGTGATAGADALHVEVDTDPNMTGIRVTMPGATADAINTNGKVTAAGGFVGALTGNAATATALSTAGAANQFWKNGNVWGQVDWLDLSGKPATFPATVPVATASALAATPTTCGAGQAAQGVLASGNATGCFTPAGTYTLPDATSLVTGGVRLTGQLGGTAVSPTVTGVTGAVINVANINATGTPSSTTFLRGDGTWNAASGGGAPTTSTYLLKTADASLPNAQVMGSLGTGLVSNTTTTGVQSIYAGTSCTNQFPRSLSAAGAATCASVDLSADTAATVLPMTKGGTGANLTGVAGGVHYSSSTTATTQTAAGAAGTILANSTANTPAWLAAGTAGQVLSSRGAAAPVYVGVQSCTSSASTTCTITVARSGCVPVCMNATAVSTWVRGTVATTTLTCTFSTSGTNTCNCFCP